MENNGFRYKSYKNSVRIGRYLQGVLGGAECEPYKVMRSWRANGNNAGGFHVTEIYTKNGATPRTRRRTNVKALPGIARIGSGVDGFVYVGCYDEKCDDQVAIKAGDVTGLKLEYNMMKTLGPLSPHVQHAFFYKNCGQKSIPLGGPAILYSEYSRGGSLRNYIEKYGNRILPDQWRSIIFQVLWTLQAIAEKHPSFRHNDLHLDNILLDDTETAKNAIVYKPKFKIPNSGMKAIVADFGFAYMDANGMRNAKVVSNEYKDEYGIYPTNHALYDAHFFLSSLLDEAVNFPRASKAAEFIKDIIPSKYRGVKSNEFISEFRLRAGAVVDIPPLNEILKSKYFKPGSRAKVINTINTAVTLKAPKAPKKSPVEKEGGAAMPVKRQMRKGQKKAAAIVGKLPSPPKKNVLNKFNMSTKSPKLRPMRRRPRVMVNKRLVGEPSPAIRNKIQELFKNASKSPGYKKPKDTTPHAQRVRRMYPDLTNVEFRAMIRQHPVNQKALMRPNRYKTPNMNMKAYKNRMARATRPFTPSPNAKAPSPTEMIPVRRLKKASGNNASPPRVVVKMVPARLQTIPAKKITKGTEKVFGPPNTMKMNNKAKWWKDKLLMKGSALKIGGKQCGSHKKGVVEEAARAMGVVVPKKATKDVICALIGKKLKGGNNSNNNSNNNL